MGLEILLLFSIALYYLCESMHSVKYLSALTPLKGFITKKCMKLLFLIFRETRTILLYQPLYLGSLGFFVQHLVTVIKFWRNKNCCNAPTFFFRKRWSKTGEHIAWTSRNFFWAKGKRKGKSYIQENHINPWECKRWNVRRIGSSFATPWLYGFGGKEYRRCRALY